MRLTLQSYFNPTTFNTCKQNQKCEKLWTLPPPGNTVIWRGLSRLTDIELGIMIGAQLVGN
jgi:hypothetical protein